MTIDPRCICGHEYAAHYVPGEGGTGACGACSCFVWRPVLATFIVATQQAPTAVSARRESTTHRRYFAELDEVYLADEDGRLHVATCYGDSGRHETANSIAALLNAADDEPTAARGDVRAIVRNVLETARATILGALDSEPNAARGDEAERLERVRERWRQWATADDPAIASDRGTLLDMEADLFGGVEPKTTRVNENEGSAERKASSSTEAPRVPEQEPRSPSTPLAMVGGVGMPAAISNGPSPSPPQAEPVVQWLAAANAEVAELRAKLAKAEAEAERFRYASDKQAVAWKDRAIAAEAKLTEAEEISAARTRALDEIGDERKSEWKRSENAEARADSLAALNAEMVGALSRVLDDHRYRPVACACAANGMEHDCPETDPPEEWCSACLARALLSRARAAVKEGT